MPEAVEWLAGQWAGDSLKRFEAMTPEKCGRARS
jgi:hypothetical protein